MLNEHTKHMRERIYYDSKTGNVDRFVQKIAAHTGWETQRISEDALVETFGHFITFTTRFGEVPTTSAAFMEHNAHFIKSVSSSGNRNWGQNFGKAGDRLAEAYKLPLLFKFELSGTSQEVQHYIKKIINYHDYKEMDIAQ